MPEPVGDPLTLDLSPALLERLPQPTHRLSDGLRSPGVAPTVAEQGACWPFGHQPCRQGERRGVQMDDTVMTVGVSLVNRQHPAPTGFVNVLGLDCRRLTRTAAGVAAHSNQVTQLRGG